MIKAVTFFLQVEKPLIDVCMWNSLVTIYVACKKWRSVSSLRFALAWQLGGWEGGVKISTFIKGIWGYGSTFQPSLTLSVFPPLLAGGCLWKHPPHHTGDEQRSDAFWCGEQRQWLSEFSHVLRQLRGPIQEAHGAPRWLQPPLAGPERHAEPGQLSATATLLQAQVENPKPVRC